jgi:hypothetical protein
MEELIQSLPKLLRAAGEADEVLEAAAFVAWRRAAGEGLRASAIPFRLYRKTLVVAVADNTWQKQLEAMSGQLLFRINSLLGQALVTFIEFRVDPRTVQAARERLRLRMPEQYADEDDALRRASELRAAASAIRDLDLRRRFLVAAGRYLNAQERK